MLRKIFVGIPSLVVFSLFVMAACHTSKPNRVFHPSFNSDSAFVFIQKQVDMGPRIPATEAHDEVVTFIQSSLQRFGWSVSLQEGKMLNYIGDSILVQNIIARSDTSLVKSKNMDYLMLCTHYDSRPWCDQEEDYDNRFEGVPGANDGASGVGVLLEIGRQVGLMKARGERIKQPIELIFFDVEDMGTPTFFTGTERPHTWCLGSQMWAKIYKNNPATSYSFGILLDMVGAHNAKFPMETYSYEYAAPFVEQVWKTAGELGYGSFFIPLYGSPIIDDHCYINSIGIPCIDIINVDAFSETGFPFWWHTRLDNMEQINKSTLQAVGEVVMQVAVKGK